MKNIKHLALAAVLVLAIGSSALASNIPTGKASNIPTGKESNIPTGKESNIPTPLADLVAALLSMIY